MKNYPIYLLALLLCISCQSSEKKSNGNVTETNNIALFNGKNLDGWRGSSAIWSVEDGCIVGRTTDENKIEKNTFLIYEKPFSNFELTFKYKIVGGNSGVQYRSKVLDEASFVLGGYQADMEAGVNHSGILYEEKGRGILAKRGEKVIINEDGSKTVEQFAKAEDIQAAINMEEWNDYRVVANGIKLQHYINGNKTIDVTDNESSKRAASGLIALQVHRGPNMVVRYKDLKINTLP
ncbi:MAG: DUF1080 domain-containing protein [Cyclobacteriaceae bacterium]